MAKLKRSPKDMISIVRMELCGAVTGNRFKNFLLNKTNMQFSHVGQFVDSSTVLGYIHKEFGNFGPYEGVRIAECHLTSQFVDCKLEGWAWVEGEENPADWCTKPSSVQDITSDSFWMKRPKFLLDDESSWPVKLTYRIDKLDGKSIKLFFCAGNDALVQYNQISS